ncbi:MAG TPA: hypothetical protein ENN19_01835 [Chloroflexi bacterium]|nr:hypothetical protein [Chloroflexota bacterium]
MTVRTQTFWRILVLLMLVGVTIACASSSLTTPLAVQETAEVTPSAPPTSTPVPTPTPVPPTLTPAPQQTPPPGKAFARGVSSYDLTQRFSLLYATDTWLWDGQWLRHQDIAGCALNPQAAGMGLGPDWTHTEDRLELDGWEFQRRTFTEDDQDGPSLVSYGLDTAAGYFLFRLDAQDLDRPAFERCRADAEAVLATFVPEVPLSGDFAAAHAALDVYEAPQVSLGAALALASDAAKWLNHNRVDGLADVLRELPKLDEAGPNVTSVDLNGDDLPDVVIQTRLMGLPVVACISQTSGRFTGQVLPFGFSEPTPTMDSGVLVDDLTGDARPETIVTYTLSGASGWTELLYVFRCGDEGACPLAFRADLINWAGPSVWNLEPDPIQPGRQQIVLTYPHLYSDGFDHKLLNHPLGRQVWRWDTSSGHFSLAEKTVDLERGAWEGESATISVADRLRWHTNEGESAFRAGDYDEALRWYDEVLTLAASEGWTPDPQGEQPDWVGYARFRRAETLALRGQADSVIAEMESVSADYAGDVLAELADAFLSGYGDGHDPDAPARGVAAIQAVDLYTHFYEERGGGLRFPLDARGVLYPGAGLAAYLDVHPEATGRAEALRSGLQGVGFAVDDVRVVEADEPSERDRVSIVLALPEGSAVMRESTFWILERDDAQWRVVPAQDELEWPQVGAFFEPVRGL